MKAKACVECTIIVEVEVPIPLIDADDDDAVWEAIDQHVMDMEDRGIDEFLDNVNRTVGVFVEEITDYKLVE